MVLPSIPIIVVTNLLFQAPDGNLTLNSEQELNDDSLNTEIDQKDQPIIFQETRYQCQLNCLAVDEAEVLALLVQLSQEQNLTPTGIRSRSLVNDDTRQEIEVQVDFISDGNNSLLQLQQILISLKSELEVSSAKLVEFISRANQ